MSQRGRLTRRRFLSNLGALGVGVAGLSACNVSTDTGNEGNNAGTPEFNFDDIPDSGAEIPDDDVTLTWIDSGDLKALFQDPFFKAYQEKYPNITIDYQQTPTETINEAVPVSFRNNTSPDVFANVTVVPTQTMIAEGWLKPLDDVIPDFDEWKARFPENAFIEGFHTFDGKTYTFPMSSNQKFPNMLFFHPAYIEEAGIDPVTERLTSTAFRDACRKITQNGGGEYYGIVTSGQQIGQLAVELAKQAGLRAVGNGDIPLTPFDLQTGQYVFDAPEIEQAFELLLALKSDKSVFPGSLGMDHPTARSRFPQKIAGFIFDGPADIPIWPRDFPDFEFDIALPPTGDDGVEYTSPYYRTGANTPFVSAQTTNAAIVGDIFGYFGTVEGQANVVVFSEGNLPSMIAEANELAGKSQKLDPKAAKSAEFAQKLMPVAADPRVRNPDVAQVILNLKPVTPDIKEIGQAVFAGEMDAKAALKKLNDDSEKALDTAIAAAVNNGASVSRDDFVFPNWDPARDYTAEMYDEL